MWVSRAYGEEGLRRVSGRPTTGRRELPAGEGTVTSQWPAAARLHDTDLVCRRVGHTSTYRLDSGLCRASRESSWESEAPNLAVTSVPLSFPQSCWDRGTRETP